MAPYADNDVRTAMKLSIDREDIVNKILGGFGSMANDQPVSNAYANHNPELPQQAYDPRKSPRADQEGGHRMPQAPSACLGNALCGRDGCGATFQPARGGGLKNVVVRVSKDGL
ncbi:hypothetical protein KUV33_20080 [Leisingera daeponensis]|nr:hypothetical protein [Leisingera daeponensis]